VLCTILLFPGEEASPASPPGEDSPGGRGGMAGSTGSRPPSRQAGCRQRSGGLGHGTRLVPSVSVLRSPCRDGRREQTRGWARGWSPGGGREGDRRGHGIAAQSGQWPVMLTLLPAFADPSGDPKAQLTQQGRIPPEDQQTRSPGCSSMRAGRRAPTGLKGPGTPVGGC